MAPDGANQGCQLFSFALRQICFPSLMFCFFECKIFQVVFIMVDSCKYLTSIRDLDDLENPHVLDQYAQVKRLGMKRVNEIC